MNDLCARFVINNPENEYTENNRFLFLIELAHWFYLDYWQKQLPYLPKITNFKQFIEMFVNEIEWKSFDMKNIDLRITEWETYKRKIPVVGAILLNEEMTHVVRVRQSKGSYFSYPRGKMNQSENPKYTCIREIKEETGIELSIDQIKEENVIKIEMSKNNMNIAHPLTYYVIPDIPMDVVFKPMSEEEIAEVKWESIETIDSRHGDKQKLLAIIERLKSSKNQ